MMFGWKKKKAVKTEGRMPGAGDPTIGFIGDKMVEDGLLTPEQQMKIIIHQRELHREGQHIPFGTLAVQKGFTTQKEVELMLLLRQLDPL